MHKSQKEQLVAELTDRLKSTETLIVADYRGLTMKEIDALRGELLKHGARFQVVKNTLTKRAAEAAGADSLLAMLDGPTAIAFLESDGDPVAVAKALADAARTTKVLAIRGGLLEGKEISEDEVKNLATLPSVEVIRAQVLGAITAPLYTIVGLFTAPLRDLVGLIDARIEQLGGAEEAPVVEAAPVEEAPAEPQAAAVEEAAPPAEEEPAPEPQAAAEEPPAEEPEAEAAPEAEATTEEANPDGEEQ